VKNFALQDDWQTRRAVEHDLQVLVEIVIEICPRLLTLHGQTSAPTSRDVVVHRYEQVDVEEIGG